MGHSLDDVIAAGLVFYFSDGKKVLYNLTATQYYVLRDKLGFSTLNDRVICYDDDCLLANYYDNDKSDVPFSFTDTVSDAFSFDNLIGVKLLSCWPDNGFNRSVLSAVQMSLIITVLGLYIKDNTIYGDNDSALSLQHFDIPGFDDADVVLVGMPEFLKMKILDFDKI